MEDDPLQGEATLWRDQEAERRPPGRERLLHRAPTGDELLLGSELLRRGDPWCGLGLLGIRGPAERGAPRLPVPSCRPRMRPAGTISARSTLATGSPVWFDPAHESARAQVVCVPRAIGAAPEVARIPPIAPGGHVGGPRWPAVGRCPSVEARSSALARTRGKRSGRERSRAARSMVRGSRTA
jgi:hypothetical protein